MSTMVFGDHYKWLSPSIMPYLKV